MGKLHLVRRGPVVGDPVRREVHAHDPVDGHAQVLAPRFHGHASRIRVADAHGAADGLVQQRGEHAAVQPAGVTVVFHPRLEDG
jgi:hypothetical protein